MKKLYIARHAKSSWKFSELSDFDRPLNKRGERDAPFMGAMLAKKNISPDLIISSPAARASKTAKVYSKLLKYDKNKIVYEQSIYDSSVISLLKLLSKQDDKYNSIMIFGHNPCFTSLSNFIGDEYLINIPTCGVVGLELNIDNWNALSENCGKQIFFEYPKKYQSE